MIHNGTTTSIAAGERAQDTAASKRQRILDAIRAAGIHGLTRDEIRERTGIADNTVRPRVRELVQARRIRPSDEQRTNAGGSACEVLVVA